VSLYRVGSGWRYGGLEPGPAPGICGVPSVTALSKWSAIVPLVVARIAGRPSHLALDGEPSAPRIVSMRPETFAETRGPGRRSMLRAVCGRRQQIYHRSVSVDGPGGGGLARGACLKDNLPELVAQAQSRFSNRPPTSTFTAGKDRVEVWDSDDFDPWETLQWPTVRVVQYRQRRPDGSTVQARVAHRFPAQEFPPNPCITWPGALGDRRSRHQ
jgi:hypothetical protein